MCVVFTTGQLIRVATVMHTKNTGSYWRDLKAGNFDFPKICGDCIRLTPTVYGGRHRALASSYQSAGETGD